MRAGGDRLDGGNADCLSAAVASRVVSSARPSCRSKLADSHPSFLARSPKPSAKLPPVYLCETGPDGASCRLKWLASTCLAGMVGVCLIGVAVYASMNMSRRLRHGELDQAGEPRRASADPQRHDSPETGRAPSGQKEDRIQMTAAGFATRQVIHDTVVERQGSREFITIKPYLRIVAGLATELPKMRSSFLPSIPSSSIPTRPRSAPATIPPMPPQAVSVNVVDVPGGLLPQADGRSSFSPDEVEPTGRRGGREFRLCRGAARARRGGRRDTAARRCNLPPTARKTASGPRCSRPTPR